MANYVGGESLGRGRGGGRGRPICQNSSISISLERSELRKPIVQPLKNNTDQSQGAFFHDKNLTFNGELMGMSESCYIPSVELGHGQPILGAGPIKLSDPSNIKDSEVFPITQEKKTYTLSPAAKEFVPRSYQIQSQSIPAVSPLTMAQPPPYTQCDMPQPMEKWSTIDDTTATPGTSTDELAIMEVENVLIQLTTNPASFDVLVSSLAVMLNELISVESTINTIAEMIVDLAITEPNFRYTGARMCSFLCKNLDIRIHNSHLRKNILERCHQEHRQFKEKVSDPSLECATHQHGFAIFLGELFLHMEVVVNDVTQKIHVLAYGLLEIINVLLQFPIDSNLKCVVQLLKFTGAELSNFESQIPENHGRTPKLDNIFSAISKCKQMEGVSWNICMMLNNIVELRTTNWGRNSLHSPHPEPTLTPPMMQPFQYRFFQNDPVLYGPDGQPLSAEETQFLESNDYDDQGITAEEERFLESQDFYFDFCDQYGTQSNQFDDDEMDEEMRSAFEQFMLENETKARQQ